MEIMDVDAAAERGVSCWLLPAAWFDLTADGSATVLETNLTLNRRIRDRMSGGVGGRRGQPRLLPDPKAHVPARSRKRPILLKILKILLATAGELIRMASSVR